MERWEYLVYTLSWDKATKTWKATPVEGLDEAEASIPQNAFNHLGEQGWELVSYGSGAGVINTEQPAGAFVIFPTGYAPTTYTAVLKRRKV